MSMVRRRRLTFTEKTGYPAKILEPGYLGEISQEELQVIKSELKNRSKLRQRWGFSDGERITNRKIQEKALEVRDGDEEVFGTESTGESTEEG